MKSGGGATLTVATANVRTLLPHQEGRAYARVSGAVLLSKVTLLEEQFSAAGLDIVGIQEGRARASLERRGVAYTMLTAPADEYGALGVQLWLAVRFQVEAWLALSPRLLWAVVRAGPLLAGFLVAHAPTETAPAEQKEEWWETLSATMHGLRQQHPLPWTVLFDANARVGSAPSPCIGLACP